MTYASIDSDLPQCLNEYVPLGLLLPEEVERLNPMAPKQRDTLVTWVGCLLEQFVKDRNLRGTAVSPDLIPGLRGRARARAHVHPPARPPARPPAHPPARTHARPPARAPAGICARHHDQFIRNMPNTWFAVARLTTDYLVLMTALHMVLNFDPDQDMMHNRAWVTHSFITLLGTFVLTSAYWMCWTTIKLNLHPFDKRMRDCYAVHALLSSTEKRPFAQLRARFDYMADAPRKLDEEVGSLSEEGAGWF